MENRPTLRTLSALALSLFLFPFASCQNTTHNSSSPSALDETLASTGDEIVVCGKRFSTGGAPVVLWSERGGFNAYSTLNHFKNTDPKSGKRYTPGRSRKIDGDQRESLIRANERDPLQLAQIVDQFVLHYDVCGVSERCFMVLHDDRELSVHFLLDVDGTIYQTMDVREQAWHAGKANTRSIGVEIAQIGAYPSGATATLDRWYQQDAKGPYVSLDMLEGWNVRTEGFIARPRAASVQTGMIHGTEYHQYDFTKEQYASLAKLTAALSRALPGLEIDAPRDTAGEVRTDVLSPEEYDRFRGVLGHYHVTTAKQDPGPAFDWDRFLEEARREAARP